MIERMLGMAGNVHRLPRTPPVVLELVALPGERGKEFLFRMDSIRAERRAYAVQGEERPFRMNRRRIYDDPCRQSGQAIQQLVEAIGKILDAARQEQKITGHRLPWVADEGQTAGAIPFSGDLLPAGDHAGDVAYLPAQGGGILEVLLECVVLDPDVATDVEN